MTKFLNIFTAAAAAVLLSVGCADDNGDNGDKGGGYEGPEGTDTYGYVTEADGTPVEGVVVSDGYTAVTTDQTGLYGLKRHADARFIAYSLPSEYRVEVSSLTGLPEFFKPVNVHTNRYDFTLERLPAPETKFTLLAIGDPQVNDINHVYRFKEETVADINAYAKKNAGPVYAVALGDLVNNKWDLIPNMVFAMQDTKVGMPVFQTIGNHDHDFKKTDDVAAVRTYETYCGPLNYSFNRGDAHIVLMDNVLHGLESSDNYNAGFEEWQYKWLQEDLSHVSKDKLIVLCVHIPFRGGADSGGSSVNKDKYYNEVLELLAQYKSATILSAHTHSNINYIHNVGGKEIYEHITGTTCGAWWKSTVCTEGTPNGYGVYTIEGAGIKEWIYKPVKYDESFQIRLYRGTDKFQGGKETYTFSKKEKGHIVANVWNADPSWVVNVYEDGTFSGQMTPYTDRDAWTVAYHVGELGGSSSYNKKTDHLYFYTLKNPDASVRVEATDRFGRKYTATEFTDPATDPGSYPEN